MKKSFTLLALLSLLLTACSTNPSSYLPSGTQPILNIEAPLAEQVAVSADPFLLKIANLTTQSFNVQYKLSWYDKEGVTQTFDPSERTPWRNFWLEPRAKLAIHLEPPTKESANYRVYLRGNR